MVEIVLQCPLPLAGFIGSTHQADTFGPRFVGCRRAIIPPYALLSGPCPVHLPDCNPIEQIDLIFGPGVGTGRNWIASAGATLDRRVSHEPWGVITFVVLKPSHKRQK